MSVEQALRDLEVALRAAVVAIVREERANASPAQAELVTVAEYARRRSISESTVRKAIREGRLEVTRVGRAVRVSADAQVAASEEVTLHRRLDRLLGGR